MPLGKLEHEKQLKGIKKFNFSHYKSSNWQSLGMDMFNDHYAS